LEDFLDLGAPHSVEIVWHQKLALQKAEPSLFLLDSRCDARERCDGFAMLRNDEGFAFTRPIYQLRKAASGFVDPDRVRGSAGISFAGRPRLGCLTMLWR